MVSLHCKIIGLNFVHCFGRMRDNQTVFIIALHFQKHRTFSIFVLFLHAVNDIITVQQYLFTAVSLQTGSGN